MKSKLCFLFSFLFVALSIAQKEKDTLAPDINFYFAAGFNVQSKWNIDQKLAASNFPTINETIAEFVGGFNVMGKKYSGDFEVSTGGFEESHNGNVTEFLTTSFRANFSFNLVNKQKTSLTTGINIGYTGNQLDLFQENAVVDLNNINTMGSMGRVTLRNGMFFAGPSAAVYLFKNTNWKLRAKAGYEFAITNGNWRSRYAAVNNTVGEQGNNRFVFSLSFL